MSLSASSKKETSSHSAGPYQKRKKPKVNSFFKQHGIRAEVSEHNHHRDMETYRNIIRELGSIRKRVDNVLNNFQEFCEDRNSAREDFDDIYFDRLMEKYEATQRERELILQSLKAFFRNQLSYLRDISAFPPSAVTIDDPELQVASNEEQFMEAWRVALSDINKLTMINRQLVDLGKEMNQLPMLTNEHKAGLMEKQQVDHLRDIFTKEAVQNLRMSRQLQEMSKEVTALRQKNEELLSEKINGESQLIHILENLEEAETKIQQLQLVVAESKQKEKLSASALKRSDAAYRHMKAEYEQQLHGIKDESLTDSGQYNIKSGTYSDDRKETTSDSSKRGAMTSATRVKLLDRYRATLANTKSDAQPMESVEQSPNQKGLQTSSLKLRLRKTTDCLVQKKQKYKPDKVLKMSKIDIHTTFLPTAASPIASLTIGGSFNPGAYRKSLCSLQLPTTCYTTPSPGTTGSPNSSAHSPALPLLDASDEKLTTNFEEEEEFEEVTGDKNDTDDRDKLEAIEPSNVRRILLSAHQYSWDRRKKTEGKCGPSLIPIPVDNKTRGGMARSFRPVWVRQYGRRNKEEESNKLIEIKGSNLKSKSHQLRVNSAATAGTSEKKLEYPYRSTLLKDVQQQQQNSVSQSSNPIKQSSNPIKQSSIPFKQSRSVFKHSQQMKPHKKEVYPQQTIQRSILHRPHQPQKNVKLHCINFSDLL